MRLHAAQETPRQAYPKVVVQKKGLPPSRVRTNRRPPWAWFAPSADALMHGQPEQSAKSVPKAEQRRLHSSPLRVPRYRKQDAPRTRTRHVLSGYLQFQPLNKRCPFFHEETQARLTPPDVGGLGAWACFGSGYISNDRRSTVRIGA